jgi:hypothetical protein
MSGDLIEDISLNPQDGLVIEPEGRVIKENVPFRAQPSGIV